MFQRRVLTLIVFMMGLLSVGCQSAFENQAEPPDNIRLMIATATLTVQKEAEASATAQKEAEATATAQKEADATATLTAQKEVEASATAQKEVEATATATATATAQKEVEALPTPTVVTISPSPTEVAIRKSIIVGSKEGTQGLLLGQMLLLALKEAGLEVQDRTGYGDSLAIREALQAGELDLTWESTGTVLRVIHGLPIDAIQSNLNKTYKMVQDLDEKEGYLWLEWLNLNDTYTLIVSRDNPATEGMSTIEELADFMNANQAPLRLCADAESLERPDGLSGLQEAYDFTFQEENIERMTRDQVYDSLRAGECDVGLAPRTDARIAAWQFECLQDTQQVFGFYNPAPVVRQATLQQHHDVSGVLAGLLGDLRTRLDDHTMSELNACVDLGPDKEPNSGDEKSVEEVARAFLAKEALACLPSKIVVSSYALPDHEWIAQALILLLSEAGYEVVDKSALGLHKAMREAILQDEIDLYFDTVHWGLTIHHQLPRKAIPNEPEGGLTLLKRLDQNAGLVWIKPSEVRPTGVGVLAVSNELYEEGIESIQNLADFMNANDAPLNLCTSKSFVEQPTALPSLQNFYNFKFKEENIIISDAVTRFTNMQNGQCDVINAVSSVNLDPWGAKALTDRQKFFMPFVGVPVIRQAVLDEYPELAEFLTTYINYLWQDTSQRAERLLLVGEDGKPDSGDEQSFETMARLILCEDGLLSNCPTIVKNRDDNLTGATPQPTSDSPRCQQIVLNESFERDGHWELPLTVHSAEYSTEIAHSGERALHLGVIDEHDHDASHSVAKQLISIPEDTITATLSYWYNPISLDLNGGDLQGALIYNSNESIILRELHKELSNEQKWNLQTHDLSAFIGEEILLYFYIHNDGNDQPSGMHLDDVTVQACTNSP